MDIYICLSNGIAFRVHSTHIELSLCWFNVVSLSGTLAQRFAFKKNCNCYFICSIWKVSTVYTKYTRLVQYCATVCDAGPELKHWINVFLLYTWRLKGGVGLDIGAPCSPSWQWIENHRHVHYLTNIGPNYRPTAVQAKRQYLLNSQVSRYCLLHLKSSIVQYLFTLQVSRNCLLPFKSIVNQKILYWSGRTRWMS